jgi:hypothetical protein
MAARPFAPPASAPYSRPMAERLQERCGGCGAAVGLAALTCAYCGAPSPHARRAREAASEAELAEAEARLQLSAAALGRTGTWAAVAGGVGLVTCCLPIGAGAALLMAHRARAQARAAGLVPPASVTAATVMGGLGMAAFLFFAVMVALEMRKEAERTAALHAMVDEAAAQAELTQPVACGLAELRLIQDGWAGTSGSSVYESLECPGRLRVEGTSAVLEGLIIRPKRGERVELTACLERGERWFVRDLVPAAEGCNPPSTP